MLDLTIPDRLRILQADLQGMAVTRAKELGLDVAELDMRINLRLHATTGLVYIAVSTVET